MIISKKIQALSLSSIGILLISLSNTVFAAEKVDVGKNEYNSACAVCHGLTGKGDDGPLKSLLARPVPNLTVLAKNNNGVFPFDRVFQIIDGRQEVKAHGPREMPIWGNAFNNQSSLYFDNYPPQDSESAARSRILALTEYLYRLQD
ncbi:MAG: cytochrome c [Methylicorpusculum sp.]|uniref:c-type cytochrome n=1 Tax=Methylicorpusculum sp. TaxID=2713644 RepID=UPI00271B3CDF|nr:cytochrome c [Methylicorpusculum sp.]MDO8940804.1 cytochrome c [Methylicorpusculum sp.]MDP2204433.1 cytochrome c [Methylicorpusculum sp.]